MKKLLCFALLQATFLQLIYSQKTINRFAVSINAGPNFNFAAGTYPETGNGPANHVYFYNKKMVGTTIGASVLFELSKKIDFVFCYHHLSNTGKKSYDGTLNGVGIQLYDFRIRDIENVFSAGLKFYVNKSRTINVESGICLDYLSSQKIAIEGWDNFITITENNFRNSNTVEGGVYLGVGIEKKIDTKFTLGIKAKAYYLASITTFEAVTFTPTLTYNF